jgi:tetratricopeptide (TPR) repeat protein
MMLAPEQRAEDAEKAGDFSVALDLWWQIASTTRDPFTFCRAGLVAERLGKWSEAQEAFEKAVKIDPMFVEGLEYLGILFLTRPDRDTEQSLPIAKELFLRALKIQPSASLLTLLGSAQSALSEKVAAKKSFEEAWSWIQCMKKLTSTWG